MSKTTLSALVGLNDKRLISSTSLAISFTLSSTVTTFSLTLATRSSTPVTWSLTPATRSSTPATWSLTPATRSSTSATLLSMASTVSTTPFTLSSTVCVAFRFCAAAIRASSSVSLSSLFSASSISVLPISFFAYFSDHLSVNDVIFICKILTHPALLDLLCRDPQNGENLDHYLNEYIHHFRSWRHLCVGLETSEKHFNALEDVDKSALACPNILSRLGDVGVTMSSRKVVKNGLHTERSTPTPANITLAGENTCQTNM